MPSTNRRFQVPNKTKVSARGALVPSESHPSWRVKHKSMSDVVLPCILACEKWEYEEVADEDLPRPCARGSLCPSGELASARNKSRGKLAALLHRVLPLSTARPETEVGTGAALTSPAAAAPSSHCRNWAELSPSSLSALLGHGSFHPAYVLPMSQAAELHPEVTF